MVVTNADNKCEACGEMMPPRSTLPVCPACMLSPAQAGELRQPDFIGPYRIIEEIGEGGFGIVYRAEQPAPLRRSVAIKVIKPGMDSRSVLQRFEAERQALALMNHPSIAQVYDGGATEAGRPYFVMEMVRGVPITQYCDKNRLSPSERIKLLIELCSAVEHAHLNGVVHRDLKPSNVLVTLEGGRPTPKVIDFGVAKALTAQNDGDASHYTLKHEVIGTPAYISPEQAQGDGSVIDARTDVYSLGVLAYEMLAGATPLDEQRLQRASIGEVQRILADEEIPTASRRFTALGNQATEIANRRRTEPLQLRRLLRGDLDWVVMKALEKDRTRRYNSARELGEDLSRFLADEPVTAHPPSFFYQLQRFAYRTRVGLVASLMIVSTFASFFIVRDLEQQKIRSEFLADAGDLVQSIRRSVNRNLQQLESVAAFHRSIPGEVSETQFRTFVSPFLARNKDIQALEWTTLVESDEVEAHEARMQENRPSYVIHPKTGEGGSTRDQHYPVQFVQPVAGNESVIGFDLFSNPSRKNAIEKAITTRSPVATEAIDLVQGEKGFLVFWPVFQDQMRLRGLALSVFRIQSMIEVSLRYLETRGLDVQVTDETVARETLFSNVREEHASDMETRVPVKVADRVWTVHVVGSPAYLSSKETWHPLGVLLGGLAFTALAAAHVGRSFKRIR